MWSSIITSIIGGFYQHCQHSIIGRWLSIIHQCLYVVHVCLGNTSSRSRTWFPINLYGILLSARNSIVHVSARNMELMLHSVLYHFGVSHQQQSFSTLLYDTLLAKQTQLLQVSSFSGTTLPGFHLENSPRGAFVDTDKLRQSEGIEVCVQACTKVGVMGESPLPGNF